MESMIRDMGLAPQGIQKIDWVEKHMPVLSGIAKQFREEQPFAGLKVVVSSSTRYTLLPSVSVVVFALVSIVPSFLTVNSISVAYL